MDIRSIIDAEPSTSTPKRSGQGSGTVNRHEPRPAPQNSPPSFQGPYSSTPLVHQGPRDNRPPQPPPLQAPSHNDFRSPSVASYNSVQSPYQPTPTSAVSSAQYPFPQHPSQSPYSTQGPHYAQRDGHSGGSHPHPMNTSYPPYSQPTQMPQTPTATTPGSAQTYHSQARPASSHSATTPTSTHAQVPNFPRQSPSSSHAQIRGATQSFSAQQYLSQPGTPLGPPSNFSRSSTSLRRESPGLQSHSRNHSTGSYGYQGVTVPSPSTEYPGSSLDSPSTVGRRQQQSNTYRQSMSVDRERSLSVSPKTRLPSQPKIDVSKPVVDTSILLHDTHIKIKKEPEHSQTELQNGYSQPMTETSNRSFSLGVNGILNAPIASEHSKQTKESPGNATNLSPQVITPPSRPPLCTSTSSNTETWNIVNPTPLEVTPSKRPSTTFQTPMEEQSLHARSSLTLAAPIPNHPTIDPLPSQVNEMPRTVLKPAAALKSMPKTKLEDEQSPTPPTNLHSQPSSRKRLRPDDIPVYARSSRNARNNPFLLGKRPTKPNPLVKLEPSRRKVASSHDTSKLPVKSEPNGHPIPTNDVHLPRSQPRLPDGGMFPWEPSILNRIPYEEVSKSISDFLFTQVVLRDDVGVVSNKGTHSDAAVLEIEAKIGQLIDRNTNDRVYIPVMSECVVRKNDPNLRLAFKSSMTEQQHKALNAYLNQALVDSKPKKGTTLQRRIEMDYKHTHECDTFYTLSQSGRLKLPTSIQNLIDPRKGRTLPKVRITTHDKTGEPIAQIIKVRVEDMDIYSPQTLFDWRISVNVEMRIEGDFRDFIELGDMGKRNPDRRKDRLSYKHLQYQIDLTQVKLGDMANKIEQEHELEIEVASQEVRKQGQLARDGKPSKFDELVRGFADNVRILVRHCKE